MGNQSRFETLLIEISTDLVARPGDDWEETVRSGLKKLGAHFGLDGLSIWQTDRDRRSRLRYQWGRPDIAPSGLGEFPWHAPWVMRNVLDTHAQLALNDLDELPAEARGDRDFLATLGITAALATPLRLGGRIAGLLVATKTGGPHEWLEPLPSRLSLVSNMMSNTIDRRRTERALRQEQTRFLRLVQAAPDAIVVIRHDGRIAFVNDQTEKLLGYGAGELTGQPLEVLVPVALQKLHRGHRKAYLADPQVREMGRDRSLNALRKDGSSVPVEINLSPIDTDEGPLVTAIMRDVTERNRAEEAVREQRDELARVSRIATVGELTGALAHELNQPLAAILSNAQAAQRFLRKDRPDMAQVKRIVADIIDDDKRAAAVIHQLRRFLKREQPKLKNVDVNRLINDTIRALNSDLAINQVSVETELSPGLSAVAGNLVQLQQVVLNLVLNAIDAMKGIDYSDRVVLVSSCAQDESFVKISVKDRGHGVDESVARKIFGPFFTTKDEGMGLGLAITRSIIEAHGGSLAVENNPDRGATFSFTVPVAGLQASGS